ncbi:hypothetical protein Ciccas_000212 [Cichlidogyrus casuarinus]|uniref:Uncharacterized protein n=1 Tax=Cichlidogyrus casuarinus TaxID=1844966 RepID=A0ABD2QNJ5_9PLAT
MHVMVPSACALIKSLVYFQIIRLKILNNPFAKGFRVKASKRKSDSGSSDTESMIGNKEVLLDCGNSNYGLNAGKKQRLNLWLATNKWAVQQSSLVDSQGSTPTMTDSNDEFANNTNIDYICMVSLL